MRRQPAVVGILAALALAGCGDDDSDTEPATTTHATQTDGSAAAEPEPAEGKPEGAGGDGRDGAGTEIAAADSQFGQIIFDSEQQAIYLFDKETSSTSECYGACAEAWPPVLTDGEPQAGTGADAKLLGTTERDDGSTQVTYAGHPLYYYVDDPPGQVLCQNVEEFGGLWLVVEPSGEAVR